MNELQQHNPELLDKDRILAISKSDMLDEELIEEMKSHLPDIETVFISSVTSFGLDTLKDIIWRKLTQ